MTDLTVDQIVTIGGIKYVVKKIGRRGGLVTLEPVRVEPGFVSKLVVEQIVRTYESMLGSKPLVDIEVDGEEGTWRVMVRLKREGIQSGP